MECDPPGNIVVRVRAFAAEPSGIAFQLAFLQVSQSLEDCACHDARILSLLTRAMLQTGCLVQRIAESIVSCI